MTVFIVFLLRSEAQVIYYSQGRLKITRGPWATELRQAPLPQKTFFPLFFFFLSFLTIICQISIFFFLVNMPVNIHNTVFCVKCE